MYCSASWTLLTTVDGALNQKETCTPTPNPEPRRSHMRALQVRPVHHERRVRFGDQRVAYVRHYQGNAPNQTSVAIQNKHGWHTFQPHLTLATGFDVLL